LIVGQGLTRVLSFFWIAYLSRTLGPGAFGEYSLIMTFIMVAIPFSHMGVGINAIREIAQGRHRTAELLGTFFWVRLTLSLACWSILLLVWPLLNYDPRLFPLFLLGGIFLVVSTSTQVAEVAYIAHERADLLWKTQLISTLGWTLFSAGVLLNHGGLFGIFVVLVINSLLMTLVHVVLFRQHSLPLPAFPLSIPLLKDQLAKGLPLAGAHLLTSAHERLDRIYISLILTMVAVGHYGLAALIVYSLVEVLWNPFNLVVYPILSRAIAEKNINVAWICRKAVLWTSFLVLPMIGVAWTTAGPLIPRLWGPAYEPAVPIFQIFMLALPLLALNRILASFLLAEQKNKVFFHIKLAVFLLFAAGDILAIRWWGLTGAVSMVVITQMIETFLYSRNLPASKEHYWEPALSLICLGGMIVLWSPLILHPSLPWVLTFVALGLYLLIIPKFIFKAEDHQMLCRWMVGMRARWHPMS